MLNFLHNHVFDPRVKNIKYHFYYENFNCLALLHSVIPHIRCYEHTVQERHNTNPNGYFCHIAHTHIIDYSDFDAHETTFITHPQY